MSAYKICNLAFFAWFIWSNRKKFLATVIKYGLLCWPIIFQFISNLIILLSNRNQNHIPSIKISSMYCYCIAPVIPVFSPTTIIDIKNCPPVVTYLNGSTLWIKAVNKENVTKSMTYNSFTRLQRKIPSKL